MKTAERERLQLAEDLVDSVAPASEWWDRWISEADRRYRLLATGADPGLTEDEFWSDEP